MHYAQTVKQVESELLGIDHFGQIAMRCGDDAGVDGDRTVRPHGLNGLGLQRAQQAGLGLGGEFADFVQEQGALVGFDERPRRRGWRR